MNVLFINGWGGDPTSFALRPLREATTARFGRNIYCPPPVNHNETGMILRYLEKWKDDQILVGLSCGCSTINEIAKHAPKGENIPFAMYFSPSRWCGILDRPVQPIIKRALEVNSWAFDGFNPGATQLIYAAPGNRVSTILPRLKTSYSHGLTPYSPPAKDILFREIEAAMKARGKL